MKKRVYVQIYNRLRMMLDESIFPVGAALPTEPKLAQMMGTSRMTLRQALDLLQEDGLIEKVRGSGNYVAAPVTGSLPILNKMGNPIDKCLREAYDRIEFEHAIEVSNDYNQKLFGQKPECVNHQHISAYLYYYSGTRLLAYTYSAIAMNAAANIGETEWQDFIVKGVYETAKRSHIEILPDIDTASLWPVPLTENEKVLYMNEKIYDEDCTLLICNKHYFLDNKCRISIEAES